MIFQSQSLASESVFGVAQISSTSQPQIQPHAEDLHLPPLWKKKTYLPNCWLEGPLLFESFSGR